MEQEFKLRLASADERDAIAQLAGPRVAVLEQANHYYAGRAWERAGLVVRLREEDGRWWLTLKGTGEAEGALHRRPEFERELPATGAAALREQPAALREQLRSALRAAGEDDLLGRLPGEPPSPLGVLHNRRQVHELPGGARLELDETRYPDGEVGHELELELDGARAEHAEATLRALLGAAGVPWRPARDSKFARFLAALDRA